MLNFLAFLIAVSMLFFFGTEKTLTKLHRWSKEATAEGQRVVRKLEAEDRAERPPPEYRPRRKLVRRPQESRPVPMKDRYEQR